MNLNETLLNNALDKQYVEFTKTFKESFKEKFEEKINTYEKEVCNQFNSNKTSVTESLKITAIEEPEDEKSILIKFNIDGDNKEVVINDTDKIKFYQNLDKDVSKLSENELKHIEFDVLETKGKLKRK